MFFYHVILVLRNCVASLYFDRGLTAYWICLRRGSVAQLPGGCDSGPCAGVRWHSCWTWPRGIPNLPSPAGPAPQVAHSLRVCELGCHSARQPYGVGGSHAAQRRPRLGGTAREGGRCGEPETSETSGSAQKCAALLRGCRDELRLVACLQCDRATPLT